VAESFDAMNDAHRAFIEAQQMFFVASAPLSADGHVNVSPKGLDTLRILDANRVAYLDLTGSGNETSSHVRENGRVTIMFCAFTGAPNVLRLYGTGRVVLPGDPAWDALRCRFGDYPGVRQVFDIDVHRVQTSCGYAVPNYDYVEQRDTLIRWTNAKAKDGIENYWREKNSRTIDGAPTPLGDLLSG